MKIGDSVPTSYGEGHVMNYREVDQIYAIELPFGSLYCTRLALLPSSNTGTTESSNTAMELNVAYEALENMRKLNLELSCQEKDIPCTPDDLEHHCSTCLLATIPTPVQPLQLQLLLSTKRLPKT